VSDSPNEDELDPEVAELMGIETGDSGQEPDADVPDFNDLMGEGEPADSSEAATEQRESFPEITRVLADKPNPIFSSKEFYKQALSGEGEEAQRLHSVLAKFLNVEDTKERTAYRQKLISAYWNMAAKIARRIHTRLPEPKRIMLRYGYLVPTLVSKEQRNMLSKVIDTNETGEPIYYIDEWLRKVASGEIGQSAQDEVKASQRNKGDKVMVQVEKARGNREALKGQIQTKMRELEQAERDMKEKLQILSDHPVHSHHGDLKSPYSPGQRSALGEIGQLVKHMFAVDKELDSLFRNFEDAEEQLKSLRDRADSLGAGTQVDEKSIEQEFNSVRQMAKMSVGRQGNHVPILMKQYFRALSSELGIRENVIKQLAEIEAVDPGAFIRSYKQQRNRIVPYVILLPCYGSTGICWEPFQKYNRATSRGRIAIPMYPKDLKTAVITAVGDLRWQVAKEKAQHYWMEEGLTGHYYEWFSNKKLRGDVKEYFIQDYVLWITKESTGMQKLEREVRDVFWRYMPFPQHLKDELKNRGYVYNELYKKDKNRAMSDGY
jgi:hypothetical protein